MFRKVVPVRIGSTLDKAIIDSLETGRQFKYNMQAVNIDRLSERTKTSYKMTMSCSTEFNADRV